MGRSTVQELIARGRNQNDYNNTGIQNNAQWVDFFNSALQDLASDIDIRTTATINYDGVTTDYDLPEDYVEIVELYDQFSTPISKRRLYNDYWLERFYDQGFYIYWAGSGYKIRLIEFTGPQVFTMFYTRLPAKLSVSAITDKPEVPAPGEDALIYYAVAKSLANNNLLGQSMNVMGQYEAQRKNIRDVIARAKLGGA